VPRGVGKVVVAVDVKDAAIVNHIVPPNSAHAYDVRFEHVPCMPARAFNQVHASVVALVTAALAAAHAGALPEVNHASHCSHSETVTVLSWR